MRVCVRTYLQATSSFSIQRLHCRLLRRALFSACFLLLLLFLISVGVERTILSLKSCSLHAMSKSGGVFCSCIKSCAYWCLCSKCVFSSQRKKTDFSGIFGSIKRSSCVLQTQSLRFNCVSGWFIVYCIATVALLLLVCITVTKNCLLSFYFLCFASTSTKLLFQNVSAHKVCLVIEKTKKNNCLFEGSETIFH